MFLNPPQLLLAVTEGKHYDRMTLSIRSPRLQMVSLRPHHALNHFETDRTHCTTLLTIIEVMSVVS